MKKYISFLLTVFIVFLFCGCQKDQVENNPEENAVNGEELKNSISEIVDDLSESYEKVYVWTLSEENRETIEFELVDNELCQYAKTVYESGNENDEKWNQLKNSLEEYSRQKKEALSSRFQKPFIIKIRLFNESSYLQYVDSSGLEDYCLLMIKDGVTEYDIIFDGTGDTHSVSPEEITKGMENALKRAEDYLSHVYLSYSGLISQLEYEKFSHEEAVYAAENCGADWNEQAYCKALEYMRNVHLSYEGLIDQLLFDGYTQGQAEYGAQMAYK